MEKLNAVLVVGAIIGLILACPLFSPIADGAVVTSGWNIFMASAVGFLVECAAVIISVVFFKRRFPF